MPQIRSLTFLAFASFSVFLKEIKFQPLNLIKNQENLENQTKRLTLKKLTKHCRKFLKKENLTDEKSQNLYGKLYTKMENIMEKLLVKKKRRNFRL